MRISDWSSDVCSSDLGKPSDATPHPFVEAVDEPDEPDERPHAGTPSSFEPILGARPRRIGRLSESAQSQNRNPRADPGIKRSEEHTSELQSLMRISYAVFCLKKNTHTTVHTCDTPPKKEINY